MARRKVKGPAAKDEGRCAVYARFSSEKQRDESIEDQLEVCAKFAREHGMRIVARYADRALSGTSDERPQFQRMIEDSEDADWGTLLVYKLDRFARDRFAAAVYRKRLRDNGVTLTSAMEQIPDSPEGIILESVIDGMNEYYSRNLAQNVRRGLHGNAEKCKANGVRVYGYDVDESDHFVINEAEARHVREAFNMAANLSTRTEIVDYLNAHGARTAFGNPFTLCSLHTLLHNEKYIGVYSFGTVRIEDGVPAIVPRELFNRVAGANRSKPRVNKFPLSGKLFVHETGEPFYGTSGTSCNGTVYMYYGATVDGVVRRYRKDDVELALMSVIEAAIREPGVAERIARAVVELAEQDGPTKRAKAAEKRLRIIERDRERLVDSILSGVPADVVAKKISELDEEAKGLHEIITDSGSADVPEYEEIVAWTRDNFVDKITKNELRQMFTSSTIDEDGVLRVLLPWVLVDKKGKKKGFEPAGKSLFEAIKFGSPAKCPIELNVTRRGVELVSGQILFPCNRSPRKK